MANETTLATAAGIINASVVDKGLLAYAIDKNVLLPRARMSFVPAGNATATVNFAIPTKGSAAAITEATGMSNTAATFTNTGVTASEVGILRQMTNKALTFNQFGDAGLDAWVDNDGAKLCLEKMETDGLAVLTSASTSVGTSGANATIGNMAGAISQASINNAGDDGFFIWTKFQARDIRSAIAASGSPILSFIGAGELMSRADATGKLGRFMGADVFESGLCPTASSDKVGAYMVDGYRQSEYAPIACALGWMPRQFRVDTPALPGRQVAVTVCYGWAEVADFNYTKIVTIG